MDYNLANTMIGRDDDATKSDMNAPASTKGNVSGMQSMTIRPSFIQKYFGSAAEVKLYDTLDNALADLAAGRLDYVSESATSLAPFLEAHKDFATKISWPLDPIFGDGVGGGVRKDDTALKDELNAGIA